MAFAHSRLRVTRNLNAFQYRQNDDHERRPAHQARRDQPHLLKNGIHYHTPCDFALAVFAVSQN